MAAEDDCDEDVRHSVRINVLDDAWNRLRDIKRESRVSQEGILSLIVEWFASLNPMLQSAILSRNVETQRELIAVVLKNMIDDKVTTVEHGPLRLLELEDLIKLQEQVCGYMSKKIDDFKKAEEAVRNIRAKGE